LPTLPGLEPKFVVENQKESNASGDLSRIIRMGDLSSETEFSSSLKIADESGERTLPF
jgi:hypothetical protein